MKNIPTCILLIAATFAAAPRAAHACTCAVSSLEQQLAYADYVFAGTVADVDTIAGTTSLSAFLAATIEVEQVWKGDVPAVFEVWTLQSSAACGYNDPWARFEIGEKFVLYALEPTEHMPQVWTHLCTRNSKYADAAEDLALLGPGNAPLPTEKKGRS